MNVKMKKAYILHVGHNVLKIFTSDKYFLSSDQTIRLKRRVFHILSIHVVVIVEEFYHKIHQ